MLGHISKKMEHRAAAILVLLQMLNNVIFHKILNFMRNMFGVFFLPTIGVITLIATQFL